MQPAPIITADRRVRAPRMLPPASAGDSLADEVRRPLAAILANVDMANRLTWRTPPSRDDMRAILADIRRDALRAGAMLWRIEEVPARPAGDAQMFDLAELIDDAVRLIEHAFGPSAIRLRVTQHGSRKMVAQGRRSELQQAFALLVADCLRALERLPRLRRVIRIAVSRQAGNRAQVSVSCPKAGMASYTPSRCAVPASGASCATPRPRRSPKLPLVAALIEAHGGRVMFGSRRSSGTRILVVLPLLRARWGRTDGPRLRRKELA